MRLDEADPKGLVRESYLIEGISAAECRSIFIDWALSLKPGVESAEALRVVLAEYAAAAPDHPMSRVLAEALTPPDPPRRRGGRAARIGS
ncbi:MAG: hypothetical protein MUC82_09985 [Cypionkella sp.]|nr:hypothetical protein [Cypionkella sp.]